MFDVFGMLLQGFSNALTPGNLLFAFIGCLSGTLVGVLPGLGPVSAVAMLFPLTTYLPPEGMIISLAAIYYGAMYGGSTTAILMNIPGEVASVPTALDGFAMAKQGKAGPALAISAIVSFMAGIFGTIVLCLIGPPLARFCLKFGPPEYLALAIFSLSAIAALSGRAVVKGFIMAGIGMLMATVGTDGMTSLPRFAYGSSTLMNGFDIAPVMIGLFGVAEILRGMEESSVGVYQGKIGKLMPNRQDLKAGLAAGGRATILGTVLGILPGMMVSIVTFIAYAFEKRQSKHPERFGKGAIEGVAAAEAANNAAAMAGFIPLLSLGIPTSGTMALILAAMMVFGVIPGPTMFTEHAQFTWTIIASFFLANVILLVLNLPLVGIWAKLAAVPYNILAPVILVICMAGAYSGRSTMFDVWVCLAFGVIGWVISKLDWPIAPLVLGYILGNLLETAFRQTYFMGFSVLMDRPIFYFFIALAALALFFSQRVQSVGSKAGLEEN